MSIERRPTVFFTSAGRLGDGERAPAALRAAMRPPASRRGADAASDHQVAPRRLKAPAPAQGLGMERNQLAGTGTVRRTPVMNWASGTARAALLAISISASSAGRQGTPSATGEALQRLPARVPAFWIRPPTSRARLRRPSNKAGDRPLKARSRSWWHPAASPRKRWKYHAIWGFRRYRGRPPRSPGRPARDRSRCRRPTRCAAAPTREAPPQGDEDEGNHPYRSCTHDGQRGRASQTIESGN